MSQWTEVAKLADLPEGGMRAVSFEDTFDAEARETFGDLGPSGDDRDRDDRGERAGSGGNRGGRRRHR